MPCWLCRGVDDSCPCVSNGSNVDRPGHSSGPHDDTSGAAHSSGDSNAPELSLELIDSLQCVDDPVMQQLGSFLSATAAKTANLRKAAFLAKKLSTLTVQKYCSLLSKLNASSGVVVSAQLHLWKLHHLMQQQLMHAAYKDLTHLNSQVLEEMQWWHNKMHQWSGKAIISARCKMAVTTDALSFS